MLRPSIVPEGLRYTTTSCLQPTGLHFNISELLQRLFAADSPAMQHRFIGNANRQPKPLAESSIGIRAHCPLKGCCAIADRPFTLVRRDACSPTARSASIHPRLPTSATPMCSDTAGDKNSGGLHAHSDLWHLNPCSVGVLWYMVGLACLDVLIM